MTDPAAIAREIREAFDCDDVARKNIALRKAYDALRPPPADADAVEVVKAAINAVLPIRWRRGAAQQDHQIKDCAPLAQAAISAYAPFVRGGTIEQSSKVEPVQFPHELTDAMDAWAFNVFLECSGRPESELEILMGGAVLDLRDLSRILAWAQDQSPSHKEQPPCK